MLNCDLTACRHQEVPVSVYNFELTINTPLVPFKPLGHSPQGEKCYNIKWISKKPPRFQKPWRF